jgi:hypothetical protein
MHPGIYLRWNIRIIDGNELSLIVNNTLMCWKNEVRKEEKKRKAGLNLS